MKNTIKKLLRENLEGNTPKNTKTILKDMGYTIGHNGLVEKDGVRVVLLTNKVYEVVDGNPIVYDTSSNEHIDIIELITNEGKTPGMASKVLDDIINVSNSLGRTLQLYPQQMNDGGLDYNQLKSWYERKGFVMNDEGIMIKTPNKVDENNINESATKRDVIDFLIDFNYLLSLNLAKVQGQAKDEKAKAALAQMQQKIKTPVVNGKTFFELADERITPRKDLFNPKFLSAVLTQVRNYLVYIKEHISRFTVDGVYRTGWLDRISKLETAYRNIIGGNQISEDDNCELTEKCWKGYTQKGMKTMFGKRYPNCVKKRK